MKYDVLKGQVGLKIKPSFQDWYKTVPKEKNDTTMYSLKEAYTDEPYSLMQKFASDPKQHLYDTYKKPNHWTFSTQSKFSTPENPGGKWSFDSTGKDMFTPSVQNYNSHGIDAFNQYMKKREPNVVLNGIDAITGADRLVKKEQGGLLPKYQTPAAPIQKIVTPKVKNDWTGYEQKAIDFNSNWLSKRQSILGQNMKDAGMSGTPLVETNAQLNRGSSAIQQPAITLESLKYGAEAPIGKYNPLGNNISYGTDVLKNSSKSEIDNFLPSLQKERETIERNQKNYPEKESLYKAYVNQNEYAKTTYNDILKEYTGPLSLHERTHAMQASPQEFKIGQILNTTPSSSYINKPTEVYSRLQEMRSTLNLDPLKKYSIEDVNKFRTPVLNNNSDTNFGTKQLFQNFNNEQIQKLLNDVAQNKNQQSRPLQYAKKGTLIKRK